MADHGGKLCWEERDHSEIWRARDGHISCRLKDLKAQQDFALRAHAGQLAAALAAAQALHNPGNKEVSRKIAALLEQCPALTDDALTALRSLASDQVIQVLTTLVSRRTEITDASTWVIHLIQSMGGCAPVQTPAASSSVVKEMLERHLPNLASAAKSVLLQNSEGDAIRIIQDHANRGGDPSDSIFQAATLALQGGAQCSGMVYPMGMDAFGMMGGMGCGMMGMMPGCFGGMMQGQMMPMGGCGMMGCGCGGAMNCGCGNGCNVQGTAPTAPSNVVPVSENQPLPAPPYAMPPGVELAADNQELLNELRSLQISDKAFQDVLKLPTLEVRFLLQKLQGEESQDISGYLISSAANFWAQGPHVPLVPAPSNQAPILEAQGQRADEKQGTSESLEEPCSLVGVAPLPKAEAIQEQEPVEEFVAPTSGPFMSWTAPAMRH